MRQRGRPSNRLRHDVTCGFIKVESCQMILRQQGQLIILGAVAQSLSQLEAFADRDGLSMDDRAKWNKLEVNLGYLVDLIAPMVLNPEIFMGFHEPLNLELVMAAYRRTAESLRSTMFAPRMKRRPS